MILELPVGDVVDKATILLIKKERMPTGDSLNNVVKEYNHIDKMWEKEYNNRIENAAYFDILYNINSKLWNLEDRIRLLEKTENFGKDFIFVARQIYKVNDQRAKVKKDINLFYKSKFVEEKFYE